MKGKVACVILVVIAVASLGAEAALITGISIPVNSMDATCHPLDSGVWSVAAPPYPLDIGAGIGNIINPATGWNFSLHDHVYSSPNVPDPARAVVTYEFDGPVAVDQVEIIQHSNGISRIEGFVGDTLGSLTSIGSIFGPSGDIAGWRVFGEYQPYVFDFGNALAGKYFQMVIRKTSEQAGYASYQIYPRDANGAPFDPIPEPASLVVLLGGIHLVLKRRRRFPGLWRFNRLRQSNR